MGNRKTAVYKTSGFHSEEKMQKHAEGLRRWIETKEFGEALQASIMVFDPPWTLPFFRRTEITLGTSTLMRTSLSDKDCMLICSTSDFEH